MRPNLNSTYQTDCGLNDINYGNATQTSELKGDALLYPKLDANGIQIFDDSQCPNNLGKNPASKDVA